MTAREPGRYCRECRRYRPLSPAVPEADSSTSCDRRLRSLAHAKVLAVVGIDGATGLAAVELRGAGDEVWYVERQEAGFSGFKTALRCNITINLCNIF